jgi:hypothetical protein
LSRFRRKFSAHFAKIRMIDKANEFSSIFFNGGGRGRCGRCANARRASAMCGTPARGREIRTPRAATDDSPFAAKGAAWALHPAPEGPGTAPLAVSLAFT